MLHATDDCLVRVLGLPRERGVRRPVVGHLVRVRVRVWAWAWAWARVRVKVRVSERGVRRPVVGHLWCDQTVHGTCRGAPHPNQLLPCAPGAYSPQEAGTRGPYAQHRGPGTYVSARKATHSAHVSRRVLSFIDARSGGGVQGGRGPGSGGWRASPGSGVSSLVTAARMAEHTASQSRPSRMNACASTSHQPSLEATATAASGRKRGAAPSAWRSRRIAPPCDKWRRQLSASEGRREA